MPIISRVPSSNITTERGVQTDKNVELNHASLGNNNNYTDLSKGQIFTGQVTNISPEEITLELNNGNTLTAKYNNLSEISIGDAAKFKVLENNDGKLLLKSLNIGDNLENAVYKALENLNIPFSSKNEELATALLKNEYPVNNQIVNSMLHQSLKNPDVSLTNLVLMNKIGLEVSPETAKLFEIFSNEQIKLTENANKVFNSMLEMLDGLLSDGNIEESIEISSKILDTLRLDLEPEDIVFKDLAPHTNSLGSLEALNSSTQSKFIKVLDDLLNNTTETLLSNYNNINKNTPVSKIFNEKQRLEIFSMFEDTNIDVEAEKLQSLINGKLNTEELLNLVRELPNSEKLDSFVKLLTTDEIPNKAIFSTIYESNTIVETTENILNLLKSDSVELSDKATLLKSPIFGKTLKALMRADFTLSVEELSSEHSVNKLYNKMYEQIGEVKRIVSNSTLPMSTALSSDLSQTASNINFMNEINHLFTFVQLPVRMDTQTTAGDLYVYSNKKKKNAYAKDGISCLLHLDMQHLGGLNVRLELNENRISTKFFLNDDSSGKLITSHLNELDSAFAKRGLSSKSEVVKSTDKTNNNDINSGDFNLIKDFIPSEIKSNNFTRYTFDMRA